MLDDPGVFGVRVGFERRPPHFEPLVEQLGDCDSTRQRRPALSGLLQLVTEPPLGLAAAAERTLRHLTALTLDDHPVIGEPAGRPLLAPISHRSRAARP